MILVTGGAGYIGSHYVLHERARGGEVVVLDDLSRGHREAALGADLVVGDVGDRPALDAIFTRHRVEAVVHFAAFAYVGESMSDPARYYRNNVVGTLTLLEAMRDHAVDALVFSSSCATYGTPDRTPIDEAHPQRPINPYGESKLACERMIAGFAEAHGLRSIALRYFNASGADPEGRIGESHDPETHLLPLVLDAASGSSDEVTVFGDDYDTPDGTCVRDYVHVCDLVAAHALALDALRRGARAGVFNLGTEVGHSVREIVAACERVTGKRVRARVAPRRAGDPARLVASAAKARAELGWAPRFTRIDDTVETAWRWHEAPRYGVRARR
jgi:UDP-glucose-4-epimerase GalE